MGQSSSVEQVEVPDDVGDDTVEDLRQAFDVFNTDRSGKASLLFDFKYLELTLSLSVAPGDLVDSMQCLGFHEQSPLLFRYLLALKAERGGEPMTFNEFLEGITSHIRGAWSDDWQEKEIEEMFRMLDTNGSGRISLRDLKKLTKELGENVPDSELAEMVDGARSYAAADDDGGGEALSVANDVGLAALNFSDPSLHVLTNCTSSVRDHAESYAAADDDGGGEALSGADDVGLEEFLAFLRAKKEPTAYSPRSPRTPTAGSRSPGGGGNLSPESATRSPRASSSARSSAGGGGRGAGRVTFRDGGDSPSSVATAAAAAPAARAVTAASRDMY
ncbi:hypothetical protein JKP88DRAFT_276303 [Tribonema minus]|uniref:EF-hand domain-containing protein n=1 Tax=Tribonema minus TaxID=303371 RepID=A0A835ZAZ4_9STRA|nr:hypothetical protein JKP88DRAFT_276303 [Tribonema minus]